MSMFVRMKTLHLLFIAVLLLLGNSILAQPFFDETSEPENGDYYVPGDTITAILTIMDDGELNGMRVWAKTDSMKAISDLQPVLALTDHYPPVTQYQIAVVVPANFKSKDTVFIFEVTATKYGKQTLEFILKSEPSSVKEHPCHCALQLYPNPAQDVVKIVSQPATQNSSLYIIASDGRVSAISNMNNADGELSVDISSLPTGEYLIIHEIDSSRASGKLIVH